MRKQGVVYEVPSRDCAAVYIGETGRKLQGRVNKHKLKMLSSEKMTIMVLQYTCMDYYSTRACGGLAKSEGEVNKTGHMEKKNTGRNTHTMRGEKNNQPELRDTTQPNLVSTHPGI